MANPNDMPEFHSVKVYLTENIPGPRHSPATHVINASHSDFISRPWLTAKGGSYHV